MTNPAASPTVSAVIPVHNGADYVSDAIESVLTQTLRPIECIVIDDGSTDATADAVRAFGDAVTYVHQERAGVSAARNAGTRLAAGELVAFLDHDDVWLPTKLERQVNALAQDSAVMALCAMNIVDAKRTVIGTRRLHPREDLITGMLTFDGTELVSCSSTGLVAREALLALGGFDAALGTSADWDLLLRTLLEGGVTYVDEPLVLYRRHGSNMSRNVAATERDMRRAYAKAFANPLLPKSAHRIRRHAYARLYRMLAGSYLECGARSDALRALALALAREPTIAIGLMRRRRGHRS